MIDEDIKKTNDSELLMLYHENDEDAKNILYMKYKFIVDILVRKYHKYIEDFNIDYQEIYSECNVGFSDALKKYQDDKESSLATFITLCIERKICAVIRKYNREKHKVWQETYSLDFIYSDNDASLMELISDEAYEPLKRMTERERYEELVSKISSILSKKEYDVFILMARGITYQEIAKILNISLKQVDNTIQRVKTKIKNVLLEKKS